MSPLHWFGIAQGVVIVFLGWVGRLVGLVLREVRTINGRISKLEQWRDDNKESNERRFHDIDSRMSRFEDRR